MNRRITLGMTITVLSSFVIILLLNVASLIGFISDDWISQNDVRGIAVQHKGQLYTLNFEEQKLFIDVLNRSYDVSRADVEARKSEFTMGPDIDKIIIYRFDQPNIEIIPVAYINKKADVFDSVLENSINLVFSAPLLNPHGLLEEANDREEANDDVVYKMLKTTYDP